jgi:hypothetical protein
VTSFVEHCARLAHRSSLFRIDAVVSTVRRQSEACTRLGQRSFRLLHAEAVVIGINHGNCLAFRDDTTEVNGDRADTSRNFHANCSLVESGEGTVDGYSFTKWRFGDSRSFDFASRSPLPWPALSLSLRCLVITLARSQKKRRQQERHPKQRYPSLKHPLQFITRAFTSPKKPQRFR